MGLPQNLTSRVWRCLPWSALVSGCAITPQPIFGSALAPGQVGLGPVWGTSFGPSTARIIGSDGAVHEVRGDGDSVLGLSPLNLGLVIPLAGVARAAVWPRLEVGAHAGWYGAGGGARLRLTNPEAGQATYLTADSQVGYAIPHDDRTSQLRRPLVGRFLVETSVAVGRRWHVLGAIGISAGYRRHGVDAGTFMTSTSVDRPFGAENTLAVERSELRLEGAIGGHLRISSIPGHPGHARTVRRARARHADQRVSQLQRVGYFGVVLTTVGALNPRESAGCTGAARVQSRLSSHLKCAFGTTPRCSSARGWPPSLRAAFRRS